MASAAAPTTPAVVPDGDDKPAIQVRHKVLLMVAILGSTLLQILDTTIANVALPNMQAALGATQETISWVLTSYVIAAGVATPITGWLQERIGARELYLLSMAGFILSSMLCGAAQSLEAMVLFRVFQGISGAFMAPLGQALIFSVNSKKEIPRAIGIYSTGIIIGPIIGPIIGGMLTESFNWRWCFYVNMPFGIACLLLLFMLLPKQKQYPRPFDLFGFAMLSIALSALQLFLDRGARLDWLESPEICIELGLAISCFWVFAVHLVTTDNPLFPRAVLKDRNLMTGAVLMLVVGSVMMATMSLLPGMMQNVFGYPVIRTGILMSARGLGVMAVMPLMNYLTPRVDARVLIFTGFAITAVAMWRMTGWASEMDSIEFLIAGMIQGVGLGIVYLPMNLLSFSTLPSRYRTEGASVINVMRTIGSSAGISFMSFMLARNLQTSHADLAQHVTAATLPIDPNIIQSMGSAGDTVMAMADGIVNQQAAMIAYLDDFKIIAVAIICVLPLVFFLKGGTSDGTTTGSDEPMISE